MGRSFEEDGVHFVYPGYVIEVMTSRFDIIRYFFIFWHHPLSSQLLTIGLSLEISFRTTILRRPDVFVLRYYSICSVLHTLSLSRLLRHSCIGVVTPCIPSSFSHGSLTIYNLQIFTRTNTMLLSKRVYT